MEELAAMNRRHALIAYVLIACTLVLALIARAAETRTGSWTLSHSDQPGKVEFGLIYHSQHNNSNHQSDWPAGDFHGVDFAKSGRQDVKFAIARDAGRFECEGYLDNGEGAGVFHFTPDDKYVSQMSALGFTGIDDEKQFSMAVLDVSVAYAKEIKSKNLHDLDTDKLIAFRIHGVTPEMVSFLRSAGYQPDEDKLIAMRIHGVSPEFMQQLKSEGYDHIDLDKLIAFRIHGVSPDFIDKIQTLGYKHPEPDQLVAMRIHGVSPEFISNLKSRGMKDLTIDQLVSLRIHGID